MTYGPLGTLVKIIETVNSSVTETRQILGYEERDAAGNITKQFFSFGEVLSGVSYFFSKDHLGSIRSIDNNSGVLQASYDFDSFGQNKSAASNFDFAYTGHLIHWRSGLYLTLNRTYSTATGRFLSRDPMLERAGVNVYAYVLNSPIVSIDPLGLSGTLIIYSERAPAHSWISFTPTGGQTTTYGTWGNDACGEGTKGQLLTNQELTRAFDASRSACLGDAAEANLMAEIQRFKNLGTHAWGLRKNCTYFARSAWKSGTGESLNIPFLKPTPSELVDAIIKANGGKTSGSIDNSVP